MTREITQRVSKQDTIYLEATAGRKIMVSSLVLTGVGLQKKHYSINFLYYWLKSFKTDLINKKAFDLFDDEAENLQYNLKDIFREMEEIEL